VQMNGDNICIITYNKDYLSILRWSPDTSIHYRFAGIIESHDRIREISSAHTCDYDKRSHLNTFANPFEINMGNYWTRAITSSICVIKPNYFETSLLLKIFYVSSFSLYPTTWDD